MTRKEFEARAIRSAEKQIHVPRGWWGTWTDVTNGTLRVKHSGSCWTISRSGVRISKHDSRTFAIAKAAKLGGAR